LRSQKKILNIFNFLKDKNTIMLKILTVTFFAAIILSCNAKDKANKGAEAQLLRLN